MKMRMAALALGTVLASLAVAAPVSVLFSGGGDFYGNFTVVTGSQSLNANAGHLLNSWSAGYNTSGVGTSFLAYCLTPTEYIGSGGNPWNADRNYFGNYGQVGWLANQAVSTTADKATVQVAIWMVLGSTVTGNDAWSQTVVTNATALAAASIGQTGAVIEYARAPGVKGQDLVEAVPEPFTMALGLAGLGVAVARRRKAR